LADSNVFRHGDGAAQSGEIGHGQATTLQTTVTGPGLLGFWWKVSSEPSNDRLIFYVGTSEKARISGETDWQWKTFSISSGSQTLKWIYSKNSSVTGGMDRAWVDQVMFVPNNVPTAAIIVAQPTNKTVPAGSNATFTATVVGSSTLKYQWRCNDTNLVNNSSAGISGATSATLALSKVTSSRAGAYSVVITNSAGAVTSSIASLFVVPVLNLAEALDTPFMTWASSSSPMWSAQTNVTADGIDAAHAGPLASGKTATLQTTVRGPGTLSVWWKVSCDTNAARLRLYVNGSERARISGEVDWEERTVSLGSGDQLLQWKYYKSSDVTKGSDRGWLDRVEFTADVLPLATTLPQTPAVNVLITDGNIVLTWPATTYGAYRILYKDDLSAEIWELLETEVSVTDDTARAVDSIRDQAQRFYRVIEE
ncbi:MAG TPA: immunoglobulin domain-containing protein, partial [Candidatus Acidoferrum sp.]|nr:immunoglobulin domain-containing protein [Candidatus Acidoferrum sp.]